ncbi:hypothetical protein [Psychrobacter sp.]|uniref:hypothetical protein n=1 Tax=Psychrobacter sp. TaxID=56811 RepID=UPI003C7093DA
MDFLTAILLSFTPQVLFGMIGGFIGGLFGIDKQAYGLKISIILLVIATISGSAVADYLSVSRGVQSFYVVCFAAVPMGVLSGFLMDALKTASPRLSIKIIKKYGDGNLDKPL